MKGAHTEITLMLKPSEIPAKGQRERYQDCWFTGSVKEEEGSSVSVNVCDGLVMLYFT